MEQVNIQSAIYSENNESIIAVIDGKTWAVPLDPANRHYAEILRQVDEGIITIQDADSN